MDIPLHKDFQDLPLIDYLAVLWPDISQRTLMSLFAAGRVRSGGRPVAARSLVRDLSEAMLEASLDELPKIPWSVPPDRAPEAAEGIEILHEDPRLIVLSKPSGLAVVPDRTRSSSSLLGFLIRREIEARKAKPPSDYVRYRIVHRLDKETSGLVLVAKTPEAERGLAADFESRRVKKEYLAILSGVVRPALLTVNCPIVPGRKGKMRAQARCAGAEAAGDPLTGKTATTEFQVLERFAETTLVRASPLEGRTHQIRVHAWAAGHPLAIDLVYGKHPGIERPPELRGMARLSLHALRYTLPGSWAEPRSFECPVPPDFQKALDSLRAARRT